MQKAVIFLILLPNLFHNHSGVGAYLDDDPSNDDNEESAYTLSDEKRLIKRLLRQYKDAGITGRPVKSTLEKVIIELSLQLIQILDLDEKNQILTSSVWVQYKWKDHILKWSPNNYSSIAEVRVPAKFIWTPDIVLYNYADERLKETRDAMIIVSHDGNITWMPPAIYKSSCKIDIKQFPFDRQVCHLKFGSWTYDGNRLDVLFKNNETKVLLNDYTESNEWKILASPAIRNEKFYECCDEPYPDLTYFLFLQRNAAFSSYLLVLPCVLLSSLTLVIFWLPPDSPAKMVLGMNIFVAFFLLLLLLADSTPQASTSVPYIGYYYCLNMILITLSSFLSVIVINLFYRGDHQGPVPNWVKRLCCCLSGTADEFGVKSLVELTRPSKLDANNTNKSSESNHVNNNDRRPITTALTPNTKQSRGNLRARFHGTPSVHNINFTEQDDDIGDGADKVIETKIGGNQLTHRLHSTNRSTSRGAKSDEDKATLRPRVTIDDRPSLLIGNNVNSSTRRTQSVKHESHPRNCAACLNQLKLAGKSLSGLNECCRCDYCSISPPPVCTRCRPPSEVDVNHHDNEEQMIELAKDVTRELGDISTAIHSFLDQTSNKEWRTRIVKQWRLLAVILDRLFFFAYLTIHLVAAFGLLVPAHSDNMLIEFIRDYSQKNYNKTLPISELETLIELSRNGSGALDL